MNSMTGFGSDQRQGDGHQVSVQISSYNSRRNLDLRVSLPRELARLDNKIRKRLSDAVSRGSLQVVVELTKTEDATGEVVVNQELAEKYFRELTAMQEKLGLTAPVTLRDILSLPDLVTVSRPETETETLQALVLNSCDAATEELETSKGSEGARLQKDLTARADILAEFLQKIEEFAPRSAEKYRSKLVDRIASLTDSSAATDDERLVKEVALYAERADIAEECTRLKSHLDQLNNFLHIDGPIGRKLEFMVQEMGREINTIGAKADDAEISLAVVEFKSELERIREQIQNIE